MDISETSEQSQDSEKKETEILDNEKYEKSPTTYKNLSKTVTNSHPLMHSPDSDLPLNENFVKYEARVDNFKPGAHSSMLNLVTKVEMDAPLDLELELPNIESYSESLPDFPDSPTLMKKSLMYDMPLEISPTDHSDTENERSVYEAVLSPNLQNVSLTMNEKYGKFYIINIIETLAENNLYYFFDLKIFKYVSFQFNRSFLFCIKLKIMSSFSEIGWLKDAQKAAKQNKK